MMKSPLPDSDVQSHPLTPRVSKPTRGCLMFSLSVWPHALLTRPWQELMAMTLLPDMLKPRGTLILEAVCSLCPSPTKCSNTQALEEGGTYRGFLGGGRGKRSTILTRLACLPFVPPHQELYAWNPLPALSFRATPSLPSHPSSSSCPSIPATDLQHQSGPGHRLCPLNHRAPGTSCQSQRNTAS